MAKKKKKTKEKKTNEERVLEQHNIEYEETSFNWIEQGKDALREAAKLGVEPESMLKTIVLQGKGDTKDFFVVCLAIVHEMHLKLVAQQLGKKQVHLADNNNLINITGYSHCAIMTIGIHAFKGFQIYFDETIKLFEVISVSAGKVGRSVRLNHEELVTLVNGKYIEVERKE